MFLLGECKQSDQTAHGGGSFSKRIQEEIISNYQTLAQVFDVRPTCCRAFKCYGRNLPGASFAGQQDTFLWVKGNDEGLEKITIMHGRACFTLERFLTG